MAYLKFQADSLFTGTAMLDTNRVLVTDEKGIVEAIIDEQDAGDDVQQFKGILTPGLINCHCHLELSHMKGLIAEETGLVDFVFKVVTQRHFAEEEILDAIKHAEDEMLANGIVAVGDICNNVLTIPQKQQQRLSYYNFIEVSGWSPLVAQTRFEKSKAYYETFQQVSNSSLSPHAPYSVSNDLWELLQPNFKNKTVTIHNQETAFEDDLFLSASGGFMKMYEMMKIENPSFQPTGKSSLQTFLSKMDSAKNVLLVHNTFITESDLAYIESEITNHKSQIFFCLCPNANLYIEKTLPPIELLRNHHSTIVLGTDSLASNWNLSIVDEMKTISKNFPTIPLEEMLQWATLNGAKALQMDDKLGSFEKGKQSGVICLDKHLNAVKRLV
jgi:cytosine/adenosine deaminase-related metal-dependent hydrolase